MKEMNKKRVLVEFLDINESADMSIENAHDKRSINSVDTFREKNLSPSTFF